MFQSFWKLFTLSVVKIMVPFGYPKTRDKHFDQLPFTCSHAFLLRRMDIQLTSGSAFSTVEFPSACGTSRETGTQTQAPLHRAKKSASSLFLYFHGSCLYVH